jgi:hypothetical protein
MKCQEKLLRLSNAAKGFLLIFLFFVLQGLSGEIAWARAVPSSSAHKLVKGWLVKQANPMASRLGSEVASVETFADVNGQAVYYVVNLRPNGFVIVPADDLVEPIVGFSSNGGFDPSLRNPLGAMVSRDLPGRVDAARKIQRQTSAAQHTRQQSAMQRSGEKAFGKWNGLLGAADNNGAGIKALAIAGISDVRVPPLLQSQWAQDVSCYSPLTACYNYYTPSGSAGNYPCGCVATAMAQYMRFWQYPTGGVGTGGFTITVGCGSCTRTAYLRGGDGLGGPYDWANMELVPDCSVTLAQRQAIGALTYDAGVAAKMDYEYGGSGAYVDDAAAAMTDTFGYSNAIFGYNSDNNIGDGLNAMINTNLDMANPVILGIYSYTNGGHAVVADGYGYDSSTLYHHLNMGWSGIDDVWYNLPNIDAPSASFDVVYGVIYNIFISGSGEIISGRITDGNTGLPISGVTVTATKAGGGTYQAVTNTNGIYAIANVPSSSTYTVIASRTGDYSFVSQAASTGLSYNLQPTSGNCWGVDFASFPSQNIAIPVVESFASAVSGEVTFTARTDSNYAISEVYFCLRLPNDGDGTPIGFEDMPSDFNNIYGRWQYSFDTTQVSDGNYVILAWSMDANGVTAWSEIAPVSIHNAAVAVTKCTVKAGGKWDSISFSGTMNAATNDFNNANNSSDANFVKITISDVNSADMDPCVMTFPVNSKTWKKGRFSYSGTDTGVKKSFSYTVKTGKFAFTASRINLSGLECPIKVDINVGGFAGTTEVNEAIVNGKRPIPIQLLMGVKNSLRVDKSKFTRDRITDNIIRIAASGGFSVADLNDANMAVSGLDVNLAGQIFTIPADSFKVNKKWNKFTCSRANITDGLASATFNFSTCTFTLTIKNANFTADAGDTNFRVDFDSFTGSDEVSLP